MILSDEEIVEMIGSIPVTWLREKFAHVSAEIKAARKVVEAARTYSDTVEQGFAAKVRPDIARASLNRSLAAYDALRGDGGEG